MPFLLLGCVVSAQSLVVPTPASIGVGDYHALLIGVSDYAVNDPKEGGVPDLKSPPNDVAAVEKLLREEFGVRDVRKLETGPQTTRASILASLYGLRKLPEGDSVVIYFGGHGLLDGPAGAQEGYWLASDATTLNPANWISNGEVLTQLEQLTVRHVSLWVDSCFGASLFTEDKAAKGMVFEWSSGDDPSWAWEASTRRSREVLTSGALQPVPDAQGVTPFVFHLDRLARGADGAFLSVEAIYPELKRAVYAQTKTTPLLGAIWQARHEPGGELILIDQTPDDPADPVHVPPQEPPPDPDAFVRAYGVNPVYVPPQPSCWMGSAASLPNYYNDEKPRHSVSITRGLMVFDVEVPQMLYQEVMRGANPSQFTGQAGLPVDSVSWEDGVAFANDLSAQAGLPTCYVDVADGWHWPAGPACLGYRLLTEAEWECTTRAGSNSAYAGSDTPGRVAWTESNADHRPHPGRGLKPNAYGIYDLSGNLWEWVWDVSGEYPEGALPDPTGPYGPWRDDPRVLRGGAWAFSTEQARVAARNNFPPSRRDDAFGLRLARSIP